MKPYKLTVATLGDEDDLREVLVELGVPFEHVSTEVPDGMLHVFTYIFTSLLEAQVYDKAARVYLDRAGIRPDFDAHICTFQSEGNYEPLMLV